VIRSTETTSEPEKSKVRSRRQEHSTRVGIARAIDPTPNPLCASAPESEECHSGYLPTAWIDCLLPRNDPLGRFRRVRKTMYAAGFRSGLDAEMVKNEACFEGA